MLQLDEIDHRDLVGIGVVAGTGRIAEEDRRDAGADQVDVVAARLTEDVAEAPVRERGPTGRLIDERGQADARFRADRKGEVLEAWQQIRALNIEVDVR